MTALAPPASGPTLELPGLHAGQQELAASPARFRVVIAGRQWGKTRAGVLFALDAAAKGGRAWWVAPSYKTANEGWEPLAALARQIPGARILLEAKEVRLPGGGRVQIRSGDEPDSLRGAKLDFLVLDEFAYMPEYLWTHVLRATLAANQGKALFISTPNGKGTWAHALYEHATSPQGQAGGWAGWQRPTATNPYITAAELADIAAQLHAAVFAQEYGAQFIDLAMVQPFKAEWFLDWTEKDWPPPVPMDISIGIDLAISKRDLADSSALVAAGVPLVGLHQGQHVILEAEKGHWSGYETADRVFGLLRRWHPRRLVIESIAYQRVFAEILAREAKVRGLPLPQVLLIKPEFDKLRRAVRVSPLVESGRVLFGPGCHELKRDLLAVPRDRRAWDLPDAFELAVGYGPVAPPKKAPIGDARDARLRQARAMASYAQAGRTGPAPTRGLPHQPGVSTRPIGRKALTQSAQLVRLLPGGVPGSLRARARGYVTGSRVKSGV